MLCTTSFFSFLVCFHKWRTKLILFVHTYSQLFVDSRSKMIISMILFVLPFLTIVLQSNCHVLKQNVSKEAYNGTVYERFYGVNQKCVSFEYVSRYLMLDVPTYINIFKKSLERTLSGKILWHQFIMKSTVQQDC